MVYYLMRLDRRLFFSLIALLVPPFSFSLFLLFFLSFSFSRKMSIFIHTATCSMLDFSLILLCKGFSLILFMKSI